MLRLSEADDAQLPKLTQIEPSKATGRKQLRCLRRLDKDDTSNQNLIEVLDVDSARDAELDSSLSRLRKRGVRKRNAQSVADPEAASLDFIDSEAPRISGKSSGSKDRGVATATQSTAPPSKLNFARMPSEALHLKQNRSVDADSAIQTQSQLHSQPADNNATMTIAPSQASRF